MSGAVWPKKPNEKPIICPAESKAGAEALIIQLNTPGGLVDSTQQIVMKMMASDIPTGVYVAPSGGRALPASTAGT